MELSNVILTKDGALRDDIPSDMDEAMSKLDKLIANRADIKILHESTFVVRSHPQLGNVIRNIWLLWDEKTPLRRWFYDNLGIFNADDMVTIILVCWHRHISKKEYNLVDLARKKLEWWENEEHIDIEGAWDYIGKKLESLFGDTFKPIELINKLSGIYNKKIVRDIISWTDAGNELYRWNLVIGFNSKTNDVDHNLDNKNKLNALIDRIINNLLT